MGAPENSFLAVIFFLVLKAIRMSSRKLSAVKSCNYWDSLQAALMATSLVCRNMFSTEMI